jgi:hypothetical protein
VKTLVLALLAATIMIGSPVYANDYADALTALAKGDLKEIAQNPDLVAAVEAQNAQTAGYDQAKIDALDKQWRAEVDASSKPLIDSVLSNAASAYLKSVQDGSEGLYTEIFATDAKGLNVGQSSVTSDYWQGDEGKWQNTYLVGPDAIDIGDVEQDESTQTFQSQVSIPILDKSGAPIGAITFGVNVEYL